MDNHLPAKPADPNEAGSLAMELGEAYQRQVAFYRDHVHLTAAEADARARGLDDTPEEAAAELARIREGPPEQVSWAELQRLTDRDPDETVAVWEDLQAEARKELESGHRTARALEWQGTPWPRARFLAVRDSFRETWPPRTGIEAALLDMAAEGFSTWLELTEQAQMLMSTEAQLERDDLARTRKWCLPHQVANEAIARVERRAEQAQKRFLRATKMLTELQQRAPAMHVRHAGQINVGQQQVNMATPSSDDATESKNLPK